MVKHTANILTASRIVLACVLLFLQVFTLWFWIIYILAALTDVLDGFLARKTHSESEFGSLLDAIADFIFVIVCFVKFLPVANLPDCMLAWIVFIALIKIGNFLFARLKTSSWPQTHSLSNRALGAALFALPFLIGTEIFQIAAIIVCVIASFEALLGVLKSFKSF